MLQRSAIKMDKTEYNVDRGRQFSDELKGLFGSSPGILASSDEAFFHLNNAPRFAWPLEVSVPS